MDSFFESCLQVVFRKAGVGLISPSGRRLVAAAEDAPTLTFHRWRDMWRLLVTPELTFCEAYANGHMTITGGQVYDAMIRLMSIDATTSRVFVLGQALVALTAPLFRLMEGTSPRKSKQNVHAHYDLGNAFYRLFLDPDMQYSCGYFTSPDQDLATAQRQKKDHIIRKLDIDQGMTVLDIGCGWGGLSLDLARPGAKVTGLTLSEEQLALARARSDEAALPVNFELKDYRLEQGVYDRIVSVGMFEHVGPHQFQRYFDQVARNLSPEGTAVVHTIGRPSPPRMVSRFITKYIFPGGYIPSLSQITTAVEKTGLLITDVECLYQHYAETFKHWRLNFLAQRDKVTAMYDDHFARIWECYLAGCEAAFHTKHLMVVQVQLKPTGAEVKLTRDYLYQD